MRLHGTHRPLTATDEATVDPVHIEAEDADFAEARSLPYAQVPDCDQLPHVTTG